MNVRNLLGVIDTVCKSASDVDVILCELQYVLIAILNRQIHPAIGLALVAVNFLIEVIELPCPTLLPTKPRAFIAGLRPSRG